MSRARDALTRTVPGTDGRRCVSLAGAADAGLDPLHRAPVSLRVLVENVLRRAHRTAASAAGPAVPDPVEAALRLAGRMLAEGRPDTVPEPVEIDFWPERVVLQDHSGVPVLADLAAIRSMVAERGMDPSAVRTTIPVDLVVDHSVEASAARVANALTVNVTREYALNGERYRFLRWAQQAFGPDLRVVPPGRGIVHQMHLEHLARVVTTDSDGLLAPDTVLGTDSHTPMVNALGVLGWGVGGIEASLALLGEPVPLLRPEVVGIRLLGAVGPGVLAADVALALTRFLRERSVVGAFVEFHGAGAAALAVPDRATIANMAPEYGSTVAFFPVDEATLSYLRSTGRPARQVSLVESYAKEQGLFGAADDVAALTFDRTFEFDLSEVRPGAAGPRRPQDRLRLGDIPASLASLGRSPVDRPATERRPPDGLPGDGAVAIAAITSCTNTSNVTAMITAGLLARRAVRRGLSVPAWVKTSLAPGSRTVTAYLDAAGLLSDLTRLGFHVVGYGCTTCIGNSGDLLPAAARAVEDGRRLVAVLSGNRNFAGRIHGNIAGAYLMSPPLVVAYALAGTAEVDLTRQPLGHDPDGVPVHLGDLWPDPDEVRRGVAAVRPEFFADERRVIFDGGERWTALDAPIGPEYDWPADSTYLCPSPLVRPEDAVPVRDLRGARALIFAPHTTTTDDISPAGAIPPGSLAASYLHSLGVPAPELNTYGCRRGNHEVLLRGTYANPRFTNRLTPHRPGGWTRHLPSGEDATVVDAAARYAADGVPVVVLAGRDYGMGSSRDWAAKGPSLLGVRAVLAESFERIHRSNLVGVGIVPLQFPPGTGPDSLGLTGSERFDIDGLSDLRPRGRVMVTAHPANGPALRWPMLVRADTEREVAYLRQGGFLRSAAMRFGAVPAQR